MHALILLSLLAATTNYDLIVDDLVADTRRAAAAYKMLSNAGIGAFPALLKRLDDQTIIENGNFQEALVNGSSGKLTKPRLGRVAFCLIQSQIEDTWPKSIRDYHALTEQNIVEWLNTYQGESLGELRIHALSVSLESVSNDISKTECTKQKADALEFLVKKLKIEIAHQFKKQ